MRVEDIKSSEEEGRPERLTVALTTEAFAKLKAVERVRKKKPSVLVKELVDEFIAQNKEFFDSQAS